MNPKDSGTETPATKSETLQPTDSEIVDWLATRCFFPNDHPEDDLIVIVPERFAAWGKFTLSPENDQRIFRTAILKAMKSPHLPPPA